MNKYALIVAGGVGKRMNSVTPKQFMLLSGKPILYYSLKAFSESFKDIKIVIVLPKEYFKIWRNLCKEHKIKINHELAPGGETRFHSVKNGLKLINLDEDGIVAIHDGVRPLVSKTLITEAFKQAESYGNVTPAITLSESLRKINGNKNEPSDRNKYRLIQTPQCFKTEILKQAYKQVYRNKFTDDATVVESSGEKIHLMEGEKNNIKITNTYDLAIAEALIKIKNRY